MGWPLGVGNRARRRAGLGLVMLLATASPPHAAETWADGPADAKTFADRYRPSYRKALPAKPLAAAGIDRLAESPAGEQVEIRARMKGVGYTPLVLRAPERTLLERNGFVVLRRPDISTFMQGYKAIYAQHLPLFVSGDSILYSLHRSYDAILKQLEHQLMVPELDAFLVSMREELRKAPPSPGRGTADDFLAVALGLLRDDHVPPVTADGDDAAVASYEQLATAASGLQTIRLGGGDGRQEDFSQFAPRGHYKGDDVLEQYFRAIVWLGRIDFPFLLPARDDSWHVDRRALDAITLMRRLVDARNLARWNRLDAVLASFVGENDSLTLPGVDRLTAALGVRDAAGLAAIPDATIVAKVRAGGLGAQRISSHILWVDLDDTGPTRTPAAFALLGQRYTPDGDVLGQVAYDRIPAMRLMPSPLDVGFAVLGNDAAAALLAPEIARYGYARKLGALRAAGDAVPETVRSASLYNLWLSSLRALAPGARFADERKALPAVTETEPWARRMLNTQLASWAELRHNTIAYAKQTYTSVAICDFPDAYVDPYPQFFERVATYAAKGQELAASLTLPKALAARVKSYFAGLESAARRLGGMAAKELRGESFSKDDLAFIGDTVTQHYVSGGCTPRAVQDGWYPKLFFDQADVLDFKPTIADVHTQPTDVGGNPVGNVLHVATGGARPMVVVIDGCGAPRAFVGLVSSYYEKVTTNFDRMNDERWVKELGAAPDVPWMKDLIGP